MMKCAIINNHTEIITMEQAEDWFRNGRFARVMKDLDSYYCGCIVSSNTPLGYNRKSRL